MLKTVPGWLCCFAATLIVFVLQLSPFPGIFLMMLAAPLWSVVLINLGFGLMLKDALERRAPPILIVPPLLWFGGYLAASAVSHWQASRFLDEAAAYNRGKQLRLDWASSDLQLDFAQRYEGGLNAQSFIERHGLTRVFVRQASFNPRNQGEDFWYTAYALVARRCPEWQAVRAVDPDAVTFAATSPPLDTKRAFAGKRFSADLCIWRSKNRPDRATVTVSMGPERIVRSPVLERRTQDIRIAYPDGTVLDVRAARAIPLSWFPLPAIGCALNSGRPSWDCFATFQGDTPSGGVTHDEEAVIAAALGLPTVTLEQRFPKAGWR